MPDPDKLFHRFRRTGDPRALGALFDATAPELLRIALFLSGSRDHAEDLVQATFLTAIENPNACHLGRPVLPWLLGILANRVRKLRRAQRRKLDSGRLHVGNSFDPVDSASRNEFRRNLLSALDRVPELYREVLALHLEAGLTTNEIAKRLDRPPGTVRTQLVRGMTKLRRELPSSGAVALPSLPTPFNLDAVRCVVLKVAQCLPNAPRLASGSGWRALAGKHGGKAVILGIATAALVPSVLILLQSFGAALPVGGVTARKTSPSSPSAPETRLETLGQLAPSARELVRNDIHESQLICQVLWAEDGLPAGSIRLRLTSEPSGPAQREYRAITDGDGMASFGPLTVGGFHLETDRGGRAQVNVRQGERSHAIIVIPRGVNVRGIVLGPDGQPIDGAGIWLASHPSVRNDGVLLAATDTAGRFELRSVEPGRRISAFALGLLPAPSQLVRGAPGEMFDVVLRLGGRAAVLEGRVIDEYGRPLEGTRIQVDRYASWGALDPGPDRPPYQLTTDADGRFAADGIGRGKTVIVWASHPGRSVWSGRVAIGFGPATELEIRLATGSTVSGVVRDERGQPLPGRHIVAARVATAPEGERVYPPPWAVHTATTDQLGGYQLAHLQPGLTEVSCIDPDYGRAGIVLELQNGGVTEWSPVLTNGRSIVGRVIDPRGNPLAGWKVWARSSESHRVPSVTHSDDTGSFSIDRCVDPSYIVVVKDPASPMFGEGYAEGPVQPGSGPLSIVVPRNQVPSSSIAGIILNELGRPVESVKLILKRVHTDGSIENGARTLTVSRGEFTVPKVPPGRYRLALAVDGEEYSLGTHDVPAEQTVHIGTRTLSPLGLATILVRWMDPSIDRSVSPVVEVVGEHVRETVALSSSGKGSIHLPPGRYRAQIWSESIAMCSETFEVLTGMETSVELFPSRGVRRRIVFPPVKHNMTQLTHIWRRASGDILFRATRNFSNLRTPRVGTLAFAPGRYSVQVLDTSGGSAILEFDVAPHDDPEDEIILPLPNDL